MNFKLKTIGAAVGFGLAAIAFSAPARANETVVIDGGV